MEATFETLDALLNVQKLDFAIAQNKKARVELPQRIAVMRLLKKRSEIEAKAEKANELKKRAQTELTTLEDEDRQFAEKQTRAQELIDAAGSDFRKVESHSKEMAQAAKRREELAVKIEAANAQLAKVQSVCDQLDAAIEASKAEEAKLRSSFADQDQELVSTISELNAKRAEFAALIPDDIMALYTKTAEKCNGIAIGKLDEDRCGICRTTIEGGRLIELKASRPLGTCPHCKRLLVVE